ncbi:MAG: hypothetical protein JXR49_15120 [Acidobacteria bacterium]|nr:hypothetical protein [Acidobacteriota bacterium]
MDPLPLLTLIDMVDPFLSNSIQDSVLPGSMELIPRLRSAAGKSDRKIGNWQSRVLHNLQHSDPGQRQKTFTRYRPIRTVMV